MAKYRRSRKRKHQPEGTSGAKPYLVGLAFSIIITLILFLIWSLVLAVSSISDSTVEYFVLGALIISTFCGGFICAMGTRKKGWISGGIVGVLYALLLLIFGSGMADTSLSLISLFNIGLAFIVGGIGGTVALNS